MPITNRGIGSRAFVPYGTAGYQDTQGPLPMQQPTKTLAQRMYESRQSGFSDANNSAALPDPDIPPIDPGIYPLPPFTEGGGLGGIPFRYDVGPRPEDPEGNSSRGPYPSPGADNRWRGNARRPEFIGTPSTLGGTPSGGRSSGGGQGGFGGALSGQSGLFNVGSLGGLMGVGSMGAGLKYFTQPIRRH